MKTLLTILLAVPFLAPGREDPNDAQNRRTQIAPVEPGEWRVEAQFRTAAVYYGAGRDGDFHFEYRQAEQAEWRRPLTPPYFAAEYANWRTILPYLSENADYEVRAVRDGTVLAQTAFRTRTSEVPVAKTVYLDPKTTEFPLVLSDAGTPDGWIRYTTKPGVTLVNRREGEALVKVTGRHLLLDGLRIDGGPVSRVIQLFAARDVIVRNCDIFNFGRPPLARPFPDHRQFFYPGERAEDGRRVPTGTVWAAGIHVHQGCVRCTVERCWIHDSAANSVAWRYYHPYGPIGVCLGRGCVQTVVRFNDIVGSDAHRWDDAIISNGNFMPDGGPGRSAEIYGNFCSLPNDDCVELDGAQQCVACFGNRFEGGLVGISIQGNVVSPSYVFNNLVSGQGDRFGECGQTVKTSGFDWVGIGPYSAVFRNVFWGPAGTGINVLAPVCSGGREPIVPDVRPRIEVFDNVFCQGRQILGADTVTNGLVRNNRMLADSDPACLSPSLPYRPLSFALDTVRRDVGRSREPIRVRFRGGCGERFEIAKNAAFDWFDVSPKCGVAQDGTELTVTFRDERMHDAPAYRGAFLVRTADGFSRPVTLYATADWKQPFVCERPGDVAVYRRADEAVKDADGFSSWTFAAPRDGRYYLLAYARADRRPTVRLAVNDEEPGLSMLQTCPDYPVWGMFGWSDARKAARMMWGRRVRWHDLKAGEKLVVRIRPETDPYDLDAVVMTDNPLAFEPKTTRCE